MDPENEGIAVSYFKDKFWSWIMFLVFLGFKDLKNKCSKIEKLMFTGLYFSQEKTFFHLLKNYLLQDLKQFIIFFKKTQFLRGSREFFWNNNLYNNSWNISQFRFLTRVNFYVLLIPILSFDFSYSVFWRFLDFFRHFQPF